MNYNPSLVKAVQYYNQDHTKPPQPPTSEQVNQLKIRKLIQETKGGY